MPLARNIVRGSPSPADAVNTNAVVDDYFVHELTQDFRREFSHARVALDGGEVVVKQLVDAAKEIC